MQHVSPQTVAGDGSSEPVDCTPGSPLFLTHHADLENALEQQRRLLAGAVSMLQQAAYLARYHQPALEREIRAFLADLNP